MNNINKNIISADILYFSRNKSFGGIQCKKIKNDTYYQIASEEVNQLVLEHKLRKEDETLEKF